MTTAEPPTNGVAAYRDRLASYLDRRSEAELYQASLLSEALVSEALVREELGPDEIVALHLEALEELTGRESVGALQRVRALDDAHHFLLEVMIGYGVHYKQHLELLLEERRRGEVEAARAERERADLLAAIAHEFATPVTVAYTHTRSALRALKRGTAERVEESLNESSTALERLTRLLSDLRYASRRGELPELVPEPCDLGEILPEVCNWVKDDIEDKDLTFRLEEGLRVPVFGDTEALKTIVGNLLSNAVRYTPRGGEVSVSTWQDGTTGCVEVQDTGIGISDDAMREIFDPFYRSEGARAKTTKGLGLGLAISRQLTEALHGEIQVESTPGAGSTFRLVLPLHEQEEVAPHDE